MKNLGKSLIALVSIFSFFAITNASSENIIFNISDKKVKCSGMMQQKCLVVNGKYFYDDIKGFNYEEGYNYKIKVKKELACTNNCPQDMSKYKYSLVKIIEVSVSDKNAKMNQMENKNMNQMKESTKIKLSEKLKQKLDKKVKKVINKIETKYKDNKKREKVISSLIDKLNKYSVKNPKLEYVIYYINNELLKQLSKYSGGPMIQY